MFEKMDIHISGINIELLPEDESYTTAWFSPWVEGDGESYGGKVQSRYIKPLEDTWLYMSETEYLGDRWTRHGILITQKSNVNDVGSSTGEQTSDLTITRISESNYVAYTDPSLAYYRIADTKLIADVGAGYTFYQYKWNANTNATLGWEGNLDASVSIGIPNTPLSVNLSLAPVIKDVKPDNWRNLNAETVDGVLMYPKRIEIDYANQLTNEDHFYAFSGKVSGIAGSSSYDKRIRIRWEFTILHRNAWGFYTIVINDSCWNQTTGTFN